MKGEAVDSRPVRELDNGEGLITRVYPEINLATHLFPHVSGFRMEMGDSNLVVLRRKLTGDKFITGLNEDGDEILGEGRWDQTQLWVAFQKDHEVSYKGLIERGYMSHYRVTLRDGSTMPVPSPRNLFLEYERENNLPHFISHTVSHERGHRDVFSVRVVNDIFPQNVVGRVSINVLHGVKDNTFQLGVGYSEELLGRYKSRQVQDYPDCNALLTVGE